MRNNPDLTNIRQRAAERQLALSDFIENILESSYLLRGNKFACGKGCNYCCYQQLLVLPEEALLIAEHIRTTKTQGDQRKIKGKAKRFARIADPYAANTPCPLLDDNGKCGVYEVRPNACRAHISVDADACEREFNLPQDVKRDPDLLALHGGIPLVADAKVLESETHLSAMREASMYGRSPHPVQLAGALYQALDNPKVETKWASGKGEFKATSKG